MVSRTALAALLVAALFASGSALFAQGALPPGESGVAAHLTASPRHGEWVRYEAGTGDTVEAWVVYPERSDKAPVVVVIHEIFGLTDWARAVADQLAAEGFLAVAPDFLSGKAPGGQGSRALTPDAARALMGQLQWAEIARRLDATVRYATALPAAAGRFGVVGYCWGGGIAFNYATEQPDLDAAVVYYGTSPATASLARVQAPVLGLYGGDDARVNATVPAAETEMRRLGKRYEVETYAGAGHAFLRSQDGRDGANLRASQQAWPRTVQFLKAALEARGAAQAAPAQVASLTSVDCVCEEEPAPGSLALAHD